MAEAQGGGSLKHKQKRQDPKNTLADAMHHHRGICPQLGPPIGKDASKLLRHGSKKPAEGDGARVKASVREHSARLVLHRAGEHR